MRNLGSGSGSVMDRFQRIRAVVTNVVHGPGHRTGDSSNVIHGDDMEGQQSPSPEASTAPETSTSSAVMVSDRIHRQTEAGDASSSLTMDDVEVARASSHQHQGQRGRLWHNKRRRREAGFENGGDLGSSGGSSSGSTCGDSSRGNSSRGSCEGDNAESVVTDEGVVIGVDRHRDKHGAAGGEGGTRRRRSRDEAEGGGSVEEVVRRGGAGRNDGARSDSITASDCDSQKDDALHPPSKPTLSSRRKDGGTGGDGDDWGTSACMKTTMRRAVFTRKRPRVPSSASSSY